MLRITIFAMIQFDGKCPNLRMSPTQICASSYRFRDIIFFKIVYLQKLGHGHRVQFSQSHHLMTYGKIYKRLQDTFALVLTVSDIYKFQKLYLQKVGQGHRVQFSRLHNSMANVKICICISHIFALRSRSAIFDGKCPNLEMSPTHFCATTYRFRDVVFIFLPPKSR